MIRTAPSKAKSTMFTWANGGEGASWTFCSHKNLTEITRIHPTSCIVSFWKPKILFKDRLVSHRSIWGNISSGILFHSLVLQFWYFGTMVHNQNNFPESIFKVFERTVFWKLQFGFLRNMTGLKSRKRVGSLNNYVNETKTISQEFQKRFTTKDIYWGQFRGHSTGLFVNFTIIENLVELRFIFSKSFVDIHIWQKLQKRWWVCKRF